MKGFLLIAPLCACLAVSGCGGGNESTAARATTAKSESEAKAPGPTVKIPKGPPPKKLVVEDLKTGSGKAARVGDEVTVEYVGVHLDGTQYSNSWTYGGGAPTFVLGSGQLVRGFDLGIRGMKAGGRRRLIVPATLIFRPGVKVERPINWHDNTVVFVADMLKVR